MKKRQVILYVIKWIALIYLTILSTTEVRSDNKKIIMLLLIGFIAIGLILEGIREFKIKKM
jgi:hypothetical protein